MKSQDPSPRGDTLLDEVIAEFLRADAAGQAGQREQWLKRYPACANGLAEYFNDRDGVDHLMTPVRRDRQAGVDGDERTHLFTPAGSPVECDTVDLRPEPPLLSTSRYRPISFHARGGMGEIWLAEDECIGRKVAVKKLRSGREAQQARFVIEAQITGQLEHPSIVPLHDLGVDDAGHPFYIMKFIQGHKLNDAIAGFHNRNISGDWSDDVKFRRLLETFVSICNVVAYAHSKGVLHRDIKPDNVMLGSYGETMVVDWGLAKVIGAPEEGRDSYVRLSGDGSTATQDGAIVGSPYYMSPEGAEGHPEAVDKASDVYLLGATLYEILTGKPPRQGSSNWELIDLARRTRPTSPRKLDRRIPHSLDAICMKAMAFDKPDRYETPTALAEDVERFLAGAATTAYKEPLVTRFGRWMRRHRRGILRSITIIGVVFLSCVAGQSYRQATMLARREQARADLAEFYRLTDEAQFFAANTDAISERVPYYDPLRAKAVGEAAQAIAATWGQHGEDLPLPEARTEYLRSHYALLLLLAQSVLEGGDHSTDPQLALALLDQAKAVQPPSRGYYQLRSRSLTLLGEQEAAAREKVRADDSHTPVNAQDHFLQGELLRLGDVGSGANILGEQAEPRRKHLVSAIEEYRRALQLDPRHYWARFQLGRCLMALGRGPEAIETLSTCIAIRPNSAWAYATRGLVTALSGSPKKSLADLDQAIKLDPDFQPAKLNRGIVHWLLKDADAALADFNAALAAPEHQRLIEAAFYRGQLLSSQQRNLEALADFSMVIDARPDFRPAYWFRAKMLFLLGRYEDGISNLRTFSALDERHPIIKNQADQRLVLGKALRKMAQEQELEGKARTRLLLAAADTLQAATSSTQPTSEMFEHLGAVQELLGNPNQAAAIYSHGLKLSADNITMRNMRGWTYANDKHFEKARDDFVESLRLRPNNPEAHAGLGFVMAELGRDDEARKEASAAWLTGADNHLVLHNVACIYARLSQSTPEKKIEHENLALAALGRAIFISRQNPIGLDADEVALIRNEKAFPHSLKARPEFEHLLTGT